MKMTLYKWPLSLFFGFSILSLALSYATFDASRSSTTILIQYAALVGLVGSLAFLGRERILTPSLSIVSAWWLMFLFYAFLSSIWSIQPIGSFIYAVTLAATSLALGLFNTARSELRASALSWAAWFAIIATLCLPLALPIRERSFGWISPNLISSIGFVVVVFATTSLSKHWRFLTAAGFAFILFSQGRTVLLAAIVYLTIMGLRVLIRRAESQMTILIFAGVLAAILSIYWEETLSLLITAVSAPLGVTDNSRLDTSLTGRAYLWEYGWQAFGLNPYFGLGFATRESYDTSNLYSLNPHSGAIALLLDLGVFGAAIFAAALLSAMLSFFRRYHRLKDVFDWSGFAFLCSYLLLLIVEPNYLQATHPISIVLMLFLSASLFRPQTAVNLTESTSDFSPSRAISRN